MKKQHLSLLFIFATVLSCNNSTQKIEIAQNIFISIPKRSDLNVKDSANYLKVWQTSFEDDHLAVFRYSINQKDTISSATLQQEFRKNIEAFLNTFNLKNIDSTYTHKKEVLQSDLNFDYISNGEKYKFFGRFLVSKQNFIAFCFQTPFPVDFYSKSIKDKIFDSIEAE